MQNELLKLAALLQNAGEDELAAKVRALGDDDIYESPEEYQERVLKESPSSEQHEKAIRDELEKFLKDPNSEAMYANLMDAIVQYKVRAQAEKGQSHLDDVGDDFAKDASLQDTIKALSQIADDLDSIGLRSEADSVDELIKKAVESDVKWREEEDTEQSKRYDSEHHHSLQIGEPKGKQERVDLEGRSEHHVKPYGAMAKTLSTRYCPEHVGVSLHRVGESTYQCSLDGAVYNWEVGWTDKDGEKHPGGSVAGQTPNSSDYASPHRLFDTRT